jgi:hypothetical protein
MAKKISATDNIAADPRDITGETDETNDIRGLHVSLMGPTVDTGDCTGDYIQTRNVWGSQNPAGSDAFNYVIQHLMIGVAWTRFSITSSSISETEDLKFYNGNDLVKQIRITCQPSGSDTEVIIGDPEFILTEGGDFLLQENGDKLILEV